MCSGDVDKYSGAAQWQLDCLLQEEFDLWYSEIMLIVNHFFRQFFREGQVALVALLLGILGLTVGLSVVSRSLSDLKQASTVDIGTKALAAADAGAEYGLYKLNQNGSAAINCATSLPNLVTTGSPPPLAKLASLQISSVTDEICYDNAAAGVDIGRLQDDVFQVNFDPTAPPGKIDVLWNNSPSVEISALYSDYSVKRYAYGVSGTNNFSAGVNNPSCYNWCGASRIANANCVGASSPIAGTNGAANLSLLRIKPIGGNSDLQVCLQSGSAIPAQSYTVTAIATTTNNTVKKVKITRDISGTMPAAFDNVIFSSGSISKP